MATGEDPSIQSDENFDSLLICNICFETLLEPKRLPCLHTFCKSCIHTYVISVKEKKDEISCPVCRQTVSSGIPDDVDNIVENLPTNYFIVSLLNKLSLVKSEKFCDSCKFHGNEYKASSWCVICDEALCEQCAKFHKGFKISADHELIPINDIAKNRKKANISKIIFCDDHKKSPVQVYCVDHKKACCTLCATLSHRKCEQVISIEEASSGVKQKPEVSDLLKQLDENIKLLTDVINCREENDTIVDKQAIDTETTVTKMVKEMKDHLDRLHNKILSELEAARKTTAMKVADDINDCKSYKSAVTNWRGLLTGVMQHGSEQQCLNILNDISPKMKKLQADIKDALKKIRSVSFEFDVSKDIKNFKHTMQSIGDIEVKESKMKVGKGNLKPIVCDFRIGRIKVIRTFNVAPNGYSSGIFLDDFLVFAAFKTKLVIKYKQEGEMLGQLSVPKTPIDLCSMSDSQIVVSTWNPSELYIINFQNMTLIRTINLSGESACGICVLNNNHFLVGGGDQLAWIDQTSGKIVKSMKTSGESYFVSIFGNNDFIYGDRKNSVSYVVNDKKKFTYTNNELSLPRGIGMDDEGNFYVAGMDSKNIHQITNKGDLIRIIPASTVGIQTSWTLRFESGTNRFLATCCFTGKATLCEIE